MKIKIPAQTVNVDAEQWAIAYSIDPKDVRTDVLAYFENRFQEIIDGLDLQPDAAQQAQA